MTDCCRAALAKITAAEKVLLMTHLRPDGDALGSVFGLAQFLRDSGAAAEVLLPGGVPARYRRFCPEFRQHLTAAEAAEFDLIISADCANLPRLGLDALDIAFLRSRNFLNIDHHQGNNIEAPLNCVDPGAASNTTLLTELLLASGREISPACATFLLTGMMTDTGCFRFANTGARVHLAAAALCDRGADLEKITNTVFFNKPLEQLQFEAELTASQLRFTADKRAAYAFIPPELLEKYHFDLKEDEGLIDILRSIDTVVIAVLIHRTPEGFRLSFRSKDRRYPVRPLAVKYQGGGHELAAGATIPAPDYPALEKLLLEELHRLLDNGSASNAAL